jgi:hypothetical protein
MRIDDRKSEERCVWTFEQERQTSATKTIEIRLMNAMMSRLCVIPGFHIYLYPFILMNLDIVRQCLYLVVLLLVSSRFFCQSLHTLSVSMLCARSLSVCDLSRGSDMHALAPSRECFNIISLQPRKQQATSHIR